MSNLLPVTQADRDAVQAFHRTMAARLMSDIASGRPTMGEDQGDAGTLVQAFAAHRLAALDSRAGDAVPAGEVEAFRRGAEAMQRKLADALRDHLNSRAAAIANGVTIPEYQA